MIIRVPESVSSPSKRRKKALADWPPKEFNLPSPEELEELDRQGAEQAAYRPKDAVPESPETAVQRLQRLDHD